LEFVPQHIVRQLGEVDGLLTGGEEVAEDWRSKCQCQLLTIGLMQQEWKPMGFPVYVSTWSKNSLCEYLVEKYRVLLVLLFNW
jgi:hypothetical protein